MRTIEDIRADFPILGRSVHGNNLIYLDNAATMQCPRQVLDAVREQYDLWQGNVHRGVHFLSEMSTQRMEDSREHIASFIGADKNSEVVFTSGTTESINIIARAFGDSRIKTGDHVITTEMEHHSNLIPWQQMCKRTGAVLDVVHVTDAGELNMEEFEKLLKYKPAVVAVTYVSNVLGTVNPVRQIIEMAHSSGADVVLDAAQAMRHSKIDVSDLGCDFLCFSGHKIGAPTGTGILYGKEERLNILEPVFYGGGMVDEASLTDAKWSRLPGKFEAGTPNISGIIGLGAAVSYLESAGINEISSCEEKLLSLAEKLLMEIPGLHILGTPSKRAGAVSFWADGIHGYDMARMLDQVGVAVRSGHHCAEPLLKRYGLTNIVRISPAFYNTEDEITAASDAVKRVIGLLK